jgi:succinate dehydrogenase / fumarate reductase membrane anchor subunit
LQVVIEDYVHDNGLKLAWVLAMKAACLLLAVACIVSVLKLGL